MKYSKLLALVMALLMLASFMTACGAGSMAYDSAAPEEAPMEDYGVMDEAIVEENGLSSMSDSAVPLPEDQKIITTMYLETQTEDLDPLLEKINSKISELGGYMESQDIYNGSSYNSYRYRYANLTVRIPAAKLSSFVNLVSENANIVSQSTTTENVTLSYVAVESRITALETEQTRLLELLAKAENMEDLLLIESRLTEVRAELEEYSSQLRVLDNRIDYSTINLNIEEVKEYTVIEEPETVWERIGSGLSRNLKDIGEGFVDFFVWLVVAVPYLLMIAVVAVVVILVIKKTNRSKKKQVPEQKDEQI